ncbi:MAG: ABC transporter ATP-binding protein [Acidobacteriota bacterium]
MSESMIAVDNLGKRYRIRHQPEGQRYVALRDVLASKLTSPLRWFRHVVQPPASGPKDFWALKDVSFEVKQGEVAGIIGRNGAGKSTLLKILSRVTEPTEGRVTLGGRVASLLEVGTGFHPELTGRENIFLNGAILGMTRAEIIRKFDEIVAFAEIAKFLDTPVKRYSSGMYVRLAFAVAAHLEQEILIVDEVLAVGDAQFQKKCLGKMGEVALGGRTVIFVSHNLSAIATLCTQGFLLSQGTLASAGRVDRVISDYLNSSTSAETSVKFQGKGTSRGPVVEIVSASRPTEVLTNGTEFNISYKVHFAGQVLVNFFFYVHREGSLALVATDLHKPVMSASAANENDVEIVWTIPAYLVNPGWHSFGMSVVSPDASVYHAHVDDVLSCMIEDDNHRRGPYFHQAWGGAVGPLLNAQLRVIKASSHD